MSQNKPPAGIVAELISLLKNITADGLMTEEQITEVDGWLAARPDCNLPQLELLRATSAALRAGGPISKEGRAAFHRAVERILPPEARKHSKTVRAARELAEQAKQKEARTNEQTAKRDAKEKARADAAAYRERNRVVYHTNFMVRGVSHENRQFTIQSHLKPDQIVYLVREPTNQYDRCAIQILIRQAGRSYDIGYVPRENTPTLAPLLDRPHKYIATCTKILAGELPVPIIDLKVYGPDADFEQEPAESVVPANRLAWTSHTWSELKASAQENTPPAPAVPERPMVSRTTSARRTEQRRVAPRLLLFWIGVCVLIMLLVLALRS
jgi:hypothetical protein